MKTLVLLLLPGMLALLPFSGNAAIQMSDGRIQRADSLLQAYEGEQSPGGAVMVMRNGQVIYSRAFGMANLSHGVEFSMQTPTNIGSTSKQFTAFAIALLQQQGKLSVDDDVRKYLPELPQLEDTVRIRHLISHTSGYREFLNALALGGRVLSDHIGRDEIIPMLQRQPALHNVPGESYTYNNTGYALLAMIVEAVCEMDYADWMKENVFSPLGMNNTWVRRNPGQIIPGSAQGYSVNSDGEVNAVPDLWASTGAGGIYTTMEDLEKWVRNFYTPVLGGAELIETIQKPFRLNDGSGTMYAYGLILGVQDGLPVVQHGGADNAHRSSLMMFPGLEGAVITQSNHSGFPGQMAIELARIFFSDAMQDLPARTTMTEEIHVIDPESFDDFVGRYELEAAPGFILEFTREDDKFFAQATGQPRFEIFSSADTTFFLTVVEASFSFHRDETGRVNTMTLNQNGHHLAHRVTGHVWQPSEDDLEQYRGRYFSNELEAFYLVDTDETGRLVVRHRRRTNPILLNADEVDVFSGDFPFMNLRFIRDEKGQVTGFEASDSRNFGVVFEKFHRH